MTFNQTPFAQLSVMRGLFAEYEAAGKFPVKASDMSKAFFERLPQPDFGMNQLGAFFYKNLPMVTKEFSKTITANVGPSGKRSKVTIA